MSELLKQRETDTFQELYRIPLSEIKFFRLVLLDLSFLTLKV